MQENRESSLKLYSLGIVTADKEDGSDLIKVTPIEEITSDNGLLKDQKRKYDVNTPDAKGVKRPNNIEGESSLVAKWLPFGQSNRLTAPDVIEGETVILFRFADTDEYYWTTIFREPKIRRQETVHYGFGNIPDKLVAFDKDTSYWLEISTKEKYLHIHTAKNDGEPFAYDFKLDTAKGNFTFTDNAGNSIFLDSQASLAEITTNNDVVVNTTNVTVNASSSTTVNSPSTKVNADTVEVNASTTTINSNTTINGSVSINGPISTGGGNVAISGNISLNGTMNSSGNVNAPNIR